MNINNIKTGIVLLLIMGSFSACKDDMLSEITEINVDRAFSPTGLEARVVNKTNIRLDWKPVNNATSYTIEIYENAEYSGTPFKVVSNIPFGLVPYTVNGLSGATQYWSRVKAMGEGVSDSKWVTATFTTEAEQIFLPVNTAKLMAKQVTLNWPAGEIATTVTLTPGNITRTLTAPEIAAGEVTIAGLTGETAYTARLLNGTKVRGTITFSTLLDLDGAIAVSPTEDLTAILTNAAGGEVFALLPGTYTVNADVTITKSISIKGARPADKPVINGMAIKLRGNAALGLKDLTLDGTGSTSGNQTILYDEASDNAYGALNVENCIIRNYVKGLMYVNLKTLIESVTFKGNIISNIECNGGDFIDFRNGIAKTLLFQNNTVYKSALARDFFRMDAGGSTNFPAITSVITISNNTFYAISGASGNRLLYIRLAKHEIYFSKNIVANANGLLTNQPATTIVAANFTANNYYNAPGYTGSTATNAKNDTGSFTLLNPGFAAPDSGNFTLSNEDLKFNGIGDPRWK